MKKIIYVIVSMLLCAGALMLICGCGSHTCTVKSPDGRVSVRIDTDLQTYDLLYDGKELISGARAQLTLTDSSLAWPGGRCEVRQNGTATEHITAPLYRQGEFDYTYNSLTIAFGNGFSLEWRVSDDGAAYRFTTSRTEETQILSETAIFTFTEDWPVTMAKSGNLNWNCSFEGFYNTRPLSQGGTDSLCFMPASIACSEKTSTGSLRVTIAESGVVNFPGSFLLPVEGESALRILHAPIPGKDYVASSTGARTYPWRILKITDSDADIPQDNLIYALAEPNRIGDDLDWIKPGFSAWEWWNDWGLEGTSFKPGINDDTYRAYIDFAAANGLEYAVLDEGWGKRGPGQNLLIPIPGLHLKELSGYAQSKGVRLVLWSVFDRLYKDAENVCSTYEEMGIAGFKPDFFNRNDQIAVEQVCALAEVAARHHIFLDLHGCFPPMGLNRTYPNIINTEGIAGLEQCKWLKRGTDFMEHDCTLAFLRTMAGNSDYTPGAMTNWGDSTNFITDFSHPGSQGTRARQVALYGIFDSPFTMLCDSPGAYVRNQETTSYIASLPRSFTRKRVLSGVLGENIVVAREGTDGNWYVSGITDFEARSIDVRLDFLPEGEWNAEIFRDDVTDGVISSDPESYILETVKVSSDDSLNIPLAPGGGFTIKLEAEITGVSFGDYVTILSNTDADATEYDNGLVNFCTVVKVSDSLYYLYYTSMGKEGPVGDFDQKMCFAWSTDGFHYHRSIPEGIDAPYPGTNILSQDGIIEMDVCLVDDNEFPFRMVACIKDPTNRATLYKSADGVNFSMVSSLTKGGNDTQNAIVVRGDSLKVFVRGHFNKDRRAVALLTCDLNGNVLTPQSNLINLPVDELYQPAASDLDGKKEILFPTFYDRTTSYQELRCYIVDGREFRRIALNTGNILSEADKSIYAAPGLVEIGGERYILYQTRDSDHEHFDQKTTVSCLKMAKVYFHL